MSKVKKAFKRVAKFVKKAAPYIATAAAMYFTAGAAMGAVGGIGAGGATAAGIGGVSWGTIASGGLTALQGYQGYQEAKAAAKAMRAAGDEQAAIDLENRIRENEETVESARRTREQQAIVEGSSQVGIGASGFASGGSSLDTFLDSVKKKHSSDIEWMMTSNASRQAIQERESAARYSATKAQAKAASRSGIGSIIGAGSSLAQQGIKYGWLK